MAILNLTEAAIAAMPFGRAIHRDTNVRGLMLIVNKASKTFACQGNLRRGRRLIRTVRVTIGRADEMGLAEARKKARVLLAQIHSGVDPNEKLPESGLTLDRALELYLGERRLAPVTINGYKYDVEHYLKPLRFKRVADISRTDVRSLLERLVARKRGRTSAAHAMRTLSAIINFAIRRDETITTSNPVSFVQLPPVGYREVPPLDLPDWWRRIGASSSPIRRDVNRLMLFTGLRRASATSIKRADVDLDGRVVRVAHMKSGRKFTLPLSDWLVEMVRARMVADEPLGSLWLFPSPTSATGFLAEPKEDGLPSPHALRHHYRTLAAAAGVPMVETMLLMDHAVGGVSGGYLHPEHLVERPRSFQEVVTKYILGRAGAA
jgi:integrase